MSDTFICETCSRNKAIGVYASQLGPISHATCQTCLDHRAEPYYLFEYRFEHFGPKSDSNIYDTRVVQMMTYHRNQYMTWEQFKEEYQK